jgi:hypothetical protein
MRATNPQRRCLFNIPSGVTGRNGDKKAKNKQLLKLNDVFSSIKT